MQPLTERSALQLARAIREGESTSREVVDAHIARAQLAHPRVNAIIADRFAQAREEADAADARVAAGEDLPPLHGVPCSIKESIALAGMPNCAGLVSRRDHRAEDSAPVVARLIEAGAIPIGVTNTSEMTMWIESVNHVYGRTRNAYDGSRIAGGSSGGEGASVGSGSTPFGLGSDIGGSIRLPAFFNGVFGHKPTSGIVPNTGQFPNTDGDAASMLKIGPLARRAEDLMAVLRVIAGPDGADTRCREVELGDPADVELAGLKVAVTEGATLGPVRRDMVEAREHAAGALTAAGAQVRHVSLKSARRALEIYLNTLGEESGGIPFAEMLGYPDGVSVARMASAAIRGRPPHTLPSAMTIFGERVAGRFGARMAPRSRTARAALAAEVDAIIGDGVLLHPPFRRVAPRHGRTVGRPWLIAEAALFNLLGLPATAVPLGLNADGIPLGVQVVAKADRDHVTIAVAMELERAMGGWVPPKY
jgi:fatty acid amide hydrolase 2